MSMEARVLHGDCLEVMATLDAESVDAIVTDPPYGLSFMGKNWDRGIPGVAFWEAALRVAKPGCHMLAFGGTRTFHRLACAIEDAGWEIRDTISWLYGSGFPKSHNLKGEWEGWGTALKPAWEPIIVARKPLAGTVAENVLAHGCGAINVDACRVPITEADAASIEKQVVGFNRTQSIGRNGKYGGSEITDRGEYSAASGRWPANIMHDGSDEVVGVFPDGSFHKAGVFAKDQGAGWAGGTNNIGRNGESRRDVFGYGDSGSAARFFYCAKASRADRNFGCDDLPIRVGGGMNATVHADTCTGHVTKRQNNHPTVKPTALMRYICRLVTPPGGVVLDPFCGSGSTGKAAVLEGFNFIGIEREAEYVEIARARIEAARNETPLLEAV